MSARTSRAYPAMLWPPSLDGEAPCPRKSSATTRWPAASASMLRPKKWRDMQTPCRRTSGVPEPTSVTATVAPVESPIRFSVIPVPSLTVTIAVQAQDEVLGAARDVAAEIAPRADLHDREGSFSQENIDALWRAGIGSLSLPVSHGGPGANLRTTAAAVRTVAGGRRLDRARVGHAPHLPAGARRRLASASTPAVRTRVFSSALAGPGAHQRAARRARARHAGTRRRPRDAAPSRPRDGFRISGRKIFSTGSYGLRWMVVWAATTEDDPDGQRSGPFLVPADAPGISIDETWDHLGMRASASNDVVFEDTPIPRDHAAALLAGGRVRPRAAHARTSWAG